MEYKYRRRIKGLVKLRKKKHFLRGPLKLRRLLQIKHSLLKLKKLRASSLGLNNIPSKYISNLLKRNALRLTRRQRLKKMHYLRRRLKNKRRLKLYKFNQARIYPVDSLKKNGYLKFFTKNSSTSKRKKKISPSKLRRFRRSLIAKKSLLGISKKMRSTNIARYEISKTKLDINYRKVTVKKAPLESRFLLNDLVSLDLLGFYNTVEPVSHASDSEVRHP